MITKDTFLVSFNIQGEGFCEPFLVTYRTEELNPYLRYPRQTLRKMKITITTLVIIEDMEVQDVIHSFNEDPAKAKQEIIDQVNDIYSDGTESYTTMEEVLDSFTFKVGASQGKTYIESQEISFNRGGTIINKEL